MKNRRLLALVVFFILCVIDILVCGSGFGIRHFTVDVMYVVFHLLLTSGSETRADARSKVLSDIAMTVWLLSSVFQKIGSGLEWTGVKTIAPVICVIVLSQLDISLSSISRNRNVRSLFKNSQVVDNILDYTRLWRYLVLYAVCCFMVLQTRGIVRTVIHVLALLTLLFLCCQMWRDTPRFMFLSNKKYLQLLAMARGKLKDNLVPEDAQGKEMDETYLKAQCCMRESRPYLDANLSLDDLARMLGTNKVYLSRAINVVSGRNFCQFVNYYRVQYAKDLMRKKPHCKMIEVALDSGFHSVVTFNMAFKLFEEMTPSEWLRENPAGSDQP